jgi:hypothetical protein
MNSFTDYPTLSEEHIVLRRRQPAWNLNLVRSAIELKNYRGAEHDGATLFSCLG